MMLVYFKNLLWQLYSKRDKYAQKFANWNIELKKNSALSDHMHQSRGKERYYYQKDKANSS